MRIRTRVMAAGMWRRQGEHCWINRIGPLIEYEGWEWRGWMSKKKGADRGSFVGLSTYWGSIRYKNTASLCRCQRTTQVGFQLHLTHIYCVISIAQVLVTGNTFKELSDSNKTNKSNCDKNTSIVQAVSFPQAENSGESILRRGRSRSKGLRLWTCTVFREL